MGALDYVRTYWPFVAGTYLGVITGADSTSVAINVLTKQNPLENIVFNTEMGAVLGTALVAIGLIGARVLDRRAARTLANA